MKKTFLFIAALLMCGIGNVMAANKVVTLAAGSGFPASYGDKNFTVDEVDFTCSGVMYNGKGSPTGYAAKQVIQLRKSGSGAGTITSSAVDGYNIASVAVYVQGTNVFSLAFDDADSVVSSTLTPKTESVKYTTADSKEGTATANIYTFEPEGTAATFNIVNDTKANYFFKIVVTYEESQSAVILDSLVIKGTASKMEYEVGEAFDPAGLEVWGIYTKIEKGDSTSQIKSGVEWTIDPETFEEVSDNASVTLVASYKDKTTADTTITGIKVTAVVPIMDVTFDFTQNLYGHKGVSSGSGEDYVSDGDIAVGEKFNENPTQIEFTVNGGTQTRFWDASKKHELRMYNGATFVLSIAGDYKIIKVEFTGTDVALTGNNVTVSEKVWEGDAAKSITFKATATTKINSIKVYYKAVAAAAANPEITPSTMANVYWEPITVTLACATEGADIYYTIDGSEPTASATKYDAPFSVSATTTVKAIAMKGGLDNSEVVSKTFTFGTVFASLEELVEKQPAKDDVAYVQVTITNAVIDSFYVSSKGYTNGIFVTAKNTAIELYTNDVPETWEAGGKVSGTIKAEWNLYKGVAELQKWEGGWDAFTYTAPAPDPYAAEPKETVQKTLNYTNMYVENETAVAPIYFYAYDEGTYDDIELQFNLAEYNLPAGTYTVANTGAVNTIQAATGEVIDYYAVPTYVSFYDAMFNVTYYFITGGSVEVAYSADGKTIYMTGTLTSAHGSTFTLNLSGVNTLPYNPTALQQVMKNANIRKAMHNGRIMILKDNQLFNLQGMLVK